MMQDHTQKEPRRALLTAVLAFVETGRSCPGVERISLLGSLTTDKINPNDADVLVTVTDDADLTALASAGRRLKGAAQSLNHGADVFLTNPRGEYIGRTCSWKRCGPGIRVACRADHCGRRHFLNDDLGVLRLHRDLATGPPADLWPAVVRRQPIPQDAEGILLSACELLCV